MDTPALALIAPFLAFILLAIWAFRRQRQLAVKLAQWEEAYRNIERQLDERTQKLRSINNMLYGEVAQHERTEDKLRKAQDYLGSIINSMPSVLVCVTEEGLITHWNASAERATDLSAAEVAGKHLWEAYPNLPVNLGMIVQTIENRTPTVMAGTRLTSQGKTYFTDITIYPLVSGHLHEAVIMIEDVTRRVMMETSMIQNEKMRSLGELAAGMAHEINNPLGAILQSVQNIERRLSASLPRNHAVASETGIDLKAMERYLAAREIPDILNNIRNAGERSARIVANMLGFSRRSQQHDPVDINALLRTCLELVEHRLDIPLPDRSSRRIHVELQLDDSLPPVPCSGPEIQQVFLNILRNACQAMASAPPPVPQLVITTWRQDGFLRASIGDNGPGMDSDIQRQIFEPFFTTKEVGQGTGLGMSISYFIITEHHGGTIEVDSSPGKGARFTIHLPLLPAADTYSIQRDKQ